MTCSIVPTSQKAQKPVAGDPETGKTPQCAGKSQSQEYMESLLRYVEWQSLEGDMEEKCWEESGDLWNGLRWAHGWRCALGRRQEKP